MKHKTRSYLAILFVICFLAFLIYTATTKATAYYYTVDEYVDQLPEIRERTAQVKGNVLPGSIEWNPSSFELKFVMAENGRQLPVVYYDMKPDIFQEDIEVVATGTLNDQGVFVAEKLLVKCPSKYEPVDGAEHPENSAAGDVTVQ